MTRSKQYLCRHTLIEHTKAKAGDEGVTEVSKR